MMDVPQSLLDAAARLIRDHEPVPYQGPPDAPMRYDVPRTDWWHRHRPDGADASFVAEERRWATWVRDEGIVEYVGPPLPDAPLDEDWFDFMSRQVNVCTTMAYRYGVERTL